jgi:hypothetical protein
MRTPLSTGWIGPSVLLLAMGLGQGCAVLHSAQVGDIDAQIVMEGKRFEIKIAEIGVDIEGMGELAKDLSKSTKREEETNTVVDLIKMSNMGPSTGYPVFRVDYSDTLIERIKEACPSGRVSGLISVRETASYGLLSGEIVKLIGYCAEGE